MCSYDSKFYTNVNISVIIYITRLARTILSLFYLSISVLYKLIEFEMYTRPTFTLYLGICELIKSAVVLLLEEGEIRELTLIATHNKWSLESNVFVFDVVRCIPLQWLRHNLLRISVQKTTTHITSRIRAIKFVSQLPGNTYFRHKGLVMHKSEWITVFYNKWIIRLIELIVIKPRLNIGKAPHLQIKIRLWYVCVGKWNVILQLSVVFPFRLSVNDEVLTAGLLIYA